MRNNVLLAVAIVLSGCVSPQTTPGGSAITDAELLRGEVFAADAVELPQIDILGTTPAMRAFVDRHVGHLESPNARWRALASAVTSSELLDLTYSEATLTAGQAFAATHGNCLSFSGMLIALARYAGIQAEFHEVDIPPDWTNRSDLLIRWRHVNVMVSLGPHGQRLLDFDTTADTSGFPGEIVTDEQAAAHFFNNLGVEKMRAGDSALAFRYFVRAIETVREFTPAWNNLGALYNRAGMVDYAEAAYLYSLELDPREFTSMSNLVRLYEIQGDHVAAADYRSRVNRYRQSNPYYHYGLARRSFEAGSLMEAERHIRDALRRKGDEHRFHLLRAQILRARGEAEQAELALRRAETLIADASG